MTRVRIIADSACDVPPELAEQLGIAVVPVFVNYGNASYADDGIELDRAQYYQQLEQIRPVPRTAAPPPPLIREYLHHSLANADVVIAITISAALSSVHNGFRLAMQDLPHGRVRLVDSGTLSMAAGWQAIMGAEVAIETGDVDSVLSAINQVRQHQRLFAGMTSMHYIRLSGRVSWATAAVGDLLRIRPIVEVRDGEVRSARLVRTRQQLLNSLVKYVREQAPLDRLAFLHTNSPEDLAELRHRLSDVLPSDHVRTVLATPGIGTHTGPGAIGVATVRQTWKE